MSPTSRLLLLILLSMAFAASLNAEPAPGPNAKPAAGKEGDTEATPEFTLAGRLRASLYNDPQLEGIQIVSAERSPEGTVLIKGLLPQESLRKLVEEQAKKALKNEVTVGTLTGPFTKVDASEMIAGRTPNVLAYLVAVERMLPDTPESLVRIQQFSPGSGSVTLCGYVETEEAKNRLRTSLLELHKIETVDEKSVIVTDQKEFAGNASMLLHDALNAIRAKQGKDVLDITTSVIRRGNTQAHVWYIRAAGHMLLDDKWGTIGDLRIAVERDGSGLDFGHSGRSTVLQRFQGPMRLRLERVLAGGKLSSVMYPGSSESEVWGEIRRATRLD